MATDAVQPTEELFTPMNVSLAGKTAFVTGGSRGIGRVIALTLAAQGADVAVTDLDPADEVRSQIREMGRKSESYATNVANADDVERMAEEVFKAFGRIDILVNNAGITRDRTFKKMTHDLWDEVIAVNLTGVYNAAKVFIDPMAEEGWGRVVNISSIVGEVGNFGQANYAAAKAGVIGLTKTLAREYARKGVTVNAIAPGFINTRMMQGIPEKAMEAVVGMTPVGRLGEPSEIAAGVAFLASPAASYITGHVLDINGGMSMGG